MAVLAKGTVADRPWGMTLGALGMRGLSGQLTLSAEGKQYRIAFDQGAVVGAYSPLVNDAAVRLAMTGNLITSSQVNDITRRIASSPHRDEVEVLAEAARLQPDQAQRLRRRLVAQRAARTFSIDRGEFVVEDQITVPVIPGSELDVRAVIYLGARNNLSEERLDAELDQLGAWFRLKPDVVADLAQYGFTEAEKPVLQMLVQGANVSDLEAANAELGLRGVRAVTYSLAACGACEVSATPLGTAAPRTPQPVRTSSTTAPPPTGMRVQTTTAQAQRTSPSSPPQTTSRTTSPSSQPPTTSPSSQPQTSPTQPSTMSPSSQPQTTSPSSQPPTMSPSSQPPTTSPSSQPTTIRTQSPSSQPQPVSHGASPTTFRTQSPSAQSQPASRGASPSSPPTSTTTHKTAPLGSRSPAAPNPPPLEPNEGPRGPRTISESTGVPRMTGSGSWPGIRNGSGGVGQDRSPSGGVARPQDRSPSGGVARPQDRSPSGGVARPQDRSPTGVGQDRSPSGGVARPQDRSPSGGVARPQDRSPSGGVRGPHDGSGAWTLRSSTEQSGTFRVSAGPTGSMRGHTPSTPPAVSRTNTSSGGQTLRPPGTRTKPPSGPPGARTKPPSGPPGSAQDGPAAKPRRPRQNTAATLEIEALVGKKLPLIDQGVDHYTLLGLPVGAPPDDVRNTYFMLARKLHPDRLSAIGIDDDDRRAQRVMARINEAFAVLNDPRRRSEYDSVLQRGGEAAVRADDAKADELAMRVMRAEEAFKQGEMALRREQLQQAIAAFSSAVELQPNEPEYRALLAWAQFAAASDKQGIASATRKALIRAAEANDNSPTARFYLGRVERMLGREREALVYFHEVLRIKPNHMEAASEARILEQRLRARR